MAESTVIVSVPDEVMLERLEPVDGASFVAWGMRSDAPPGITMVVVPYMSEPGILSYLDGSGVSVAQSQSIGYDGVAEVLPDGIVFCNAAGVHEASTAELAVALTLASLRGLPDFVHAQSERRWAHAQYESLADKRVLILGQGGVGRATASRFRAFETTVDRIARTARDDDHGHVYEFGALHSLIPHADVIVLAVPLTELTTRLVDAAFIARMKPGALIVNVSRGAVIDTDALGRALTNHDIRAALDVTDPEPLPAGHPLWSAPGTFISPHVGGHSGAMAPRIDRLIREQTARIVRGEDPVNVVLRP